MPRCAPMRIGADRALARRRRRRAGRGDRRPPRARCRRTSALPAARCPTARALAGNLDRWPPEVARRGALGLRMPLQREAQSRRGAAACASNSAGATACWSGATSRRSSGCARCWPRASPGRPCGVPRRAARRLRCCAARWRCGCGPSTRTAHGDRAPATCRAACRSPTAPTSSTGWARRMNDMLDRIDRLMAGVRGVSDAIAHDLRTPIARARAKLEEALAQRRRRARRCARRWSRASPTSTTSRASSRRAAAHRRGRGRRAPRRLRAARPGAAAGRCGGVLRRGGRERAASAGDADLPARLDVVGDRDLLAQAVGNLLDNALKFTPEGGTCGSRRAAPDASGSRSRSPMTARASPEPTARARASASSAPMPRAHAGLGARPVAGARGGAAAWRRPAAGRYPSRDAAARPDRHAAPASGLTRRPARPAG